MPLSSSHLIDWATDVTPPDAQLWRMKLHEMAYLGECSDELFAALVADWIAHNPPTQRGAWKDAWNSFTVSIRTVIWMQELARRTDLDCLLVAQIEASLAQQLQFLMRNLENDIGGNHLIKNIKALIWGSAYFEGDDAKSWRNTAIDLLKTELPVQVLSDGMHFERSPSYHCQVFADLLECRHVLRGDPFGGGLDDALHRMAQATADLTHPDGAVAQFNDSGLTMATLPDACLDAYECLFNTRPQRQHVFAFKDAGLFGLRRGDTYFVADCGRIAPDDLPAHGHGDILSFEWSVDGQRIIVDQGVGQYSPGPRRQFARSAVSHNTLCFAGFDQADFFSAFRCGRRPDVEVRIWQPRADGFTLEGAHNGFEHLPGSPIHVRRFETSASEIVIEDRIEGEPREEATIGFLLHPNVRAQVTGDQTILRFGQREVSISATQPIRAEDAVWWADLGRELPTTRLRIALPAKIRSLRTVLRVPDPGTHA
ncbi:heparinase II/III family protein [Leptospira interrogans]